MPLCLRRQPDTRPDQGFYYVHDDVEGVVGRVYDGAPTSPPGTAEPWFWGLDHFKARGVTPYYGKAASRDEAMARFRAAWDARARPQTTPEGGDT